MSEKNSRQKKPHNGKPASKGRRLVYLTQLRGDETDAELEALGEQLAAAFDGVFDEAPD
jgi:hypothetical protein